MKSPSRALIAILALTLAAPLAAQAQEPASPGTYSRNKLEATGKLSRTGDCQILTDKDGKKHALAGDLSAFRDGETIFVRGTVGETSPCTDGLTIQVVDAEAVRGNEKTQAAVSKEKPAMKHTVVQGKALPKAGKKMVVRGVLTAEGVECQALRGDDGTLYTLAGVAGKMEGFEVDDRVRVEGTVAEMSICQQGTTLDVKKIHKDEKKD
jgi:hypothetical protein